MSYNPDQIARLSFKKICCAAKIFRECTLQDESYGQKVFGGWRVPQCDAEQLGIDRKTRWWMKKKNNAPSCIGL